MDPMHTKTLFDKYLLKLQIFFFFLFQSVLSFAINPNVVNFSPKIYGGSNKNWSITSDENSIIYVGNDKGLIEFDGIEWKLSKLPSKGIVRSVGVLNNHTIFTGGTEEFGKWERGLSGNLEYHSLSVLTNPGELRNNDFWRTFVTKEGVYFQSFSSIFFYNYKTVVKLKSIEAPLMLLNKVRGELLYQKMKSAVYSLQGNKAVKFPGSDIFNNTDVRVILPYGRDGYLFATATKGLIVYQNGAYRNFDERLSRFFQNKEINAGVLTPRGTYVLGTLLDGLYEIDQSSNIINHFSSEDVLQNNSVLAIWQDSKQNIWLGLDQGISFISYKPGLSYYTNSIERIGSIYAACYWNKYILLGTNQGVFYIPQAALKSYLTKSDVHFIAGTEGQVWNLKVIDGQLFCCHNNGLLSIGTDMSVKQYIDIGTGVYNISKEQVEGKDYLALSSYQSVKWIDPRTHKLYTPRGIDEPIYNVQTDHLGNLWFEHPNRGVYRCKWSPGDTHYSTVRYYGGMHSKGLPYKLQIFKVGGRANLIGDGQAFHYNDIEDKIIPNKTLNKLFADIEPIRKIFPCSSNLYVALAENSVYLFSYDGYRASIVNSYAIGHNLSFVDNYESMICLNDSVNLLCLTDGFILYNIPKAVKKAKISPAHVEAPVIKSIKSINREKEVRFYKLHGDGIKIVNTFNTVEICFTIKNSYSESVAGQYKLDGVDIGWSQKAALNKVFYERLPSGTYTFRVRAVDVQGNFSPEAILQFKVLPPWYNTYWAYILYAILVVALLYASWLLILMRYKKQHLRNLRKLENLRLKMLADELQVQVNQKNAELVTQTSFIIQKNELIEKVKSLIDDFYSKNKSAVLQQLIYKINNLLSNNLDTEEDWKNFLIQFEEKHTNFFKNLKLHYPSLTSTDLRLCACLKLNMETKDIASLMNLSVRAIENNRYRLRKKFDLRTEQNLNEFLIAMD